MEIPRNYTAIAEWMSCMLFILIIVKRLPFVETILVTAVACRMQVALFMETRVVPLVLWLPCMFVAVVLMCMFIGISCKVNMRDAIYYGTTAFILAEFIASFEWQISSFISKVHVPTFTEAKVLVFVVYNVVAAILYILLRQHIPQDGEMHLTRRDLIAHLLTVAGIFALSNFSYLSIETPFTSNDHFQIANIRTLVDAGGVVLLYAQLMRTSEINARRELETVNGVLQSQYTQYQQSKDAIDLINYRYHDLKHQIAYLRSEDDPVKRAAYLSRMEDEIRQYDARNKTGNKVLDTILTAKSLYCAQNGISMTSVADGTLLEFMDVMDICSIFGNALDNAIECVSKIKDEERRLIHVTVASQKTFLLLRFENYYEEAPQIQDGHYATTKQDAGNHGYGIKSIEYTVAKYDGAMDIETKDHWFTLRILIPMTE